MECIYIGVDKRQCFLRFRCEGIYQFMKYLNVNDQEANLFSKYTPAKKTKSRDAF